ncbi:hypothetical protein [Kitasatospora azatica]|uniref:hypothetical protein n=1 Tax=Kitasatospora azatica TaxID=58347 RepID=UPI00056433F0|nr:hypothetical protein [Kitasatospora azatica]
MWIWTLLGIVFVAVPLGCWAVLLRTAVVGSVVGALLLTYAAVVVAMHLEWIPDEIQAEVYLAYAPLTVALIALGTLTEGRLRGKRPSKVYVDMPGAVVTALCVYLAATALAAPGYLMFQSYDSFVPSSTSVLPLPGGLTVLSDTTECTTDSCDRYLVIGGTHGQPPDQVVLRLKAHLISAHGWQLGPSDTAQQRFGWLLIHHQVRLTLTSTDQGARVELDGVYP